MTAVHAKGVAALLQGGRVLVAGTTQAGDVYSPDTGTWTATGPLVDPNLQGSAAALLPNGQVLDAGGYSVVCGVENCDYPPSAGAELYTP
jgi:hypothetical protein